MTERKNRGTVCSCSTPRPRNLIRFRGIAFAMFLSFAAISLNGCGKKAPVQDTTTAAETSSAAAAATAASDAAAVTSTVSETSEAVSASSAALGKPGEYTDEQKAAEQALKDAAAAAPFHDEDFRRNVAAGMEARWEILDSADPETMSPEEFRDYAADSVQAELDAIGDFYLYSFNNKDAEQAAGKYLNALEGQMQGILQITAPEDLNRNAAYLGGFWLRIIAIHDLAETGEIPVSEKHQPDLDALLAQYEDAMTVLKEDSSRYN